MDRVIPTFASLPQALAQTSSDGPDGHQRPDSPPEGSQEKSPARNPGTSGLARATC